MKLLLAEDDPRNRDMLARRRRRRGHEVVETENGKQAIEQVLSDAPDLILMNIAMPVLDGWQAMERILAVAPSLPIVVLSAHSLADDRRRAFEAGARAYLSKPVDFQLLLETLAQGLDGHVL